MINITYSEFNTPLGDMVAYATNDGLCLLDFKSPGFQVKIKALEKLLKLETINGENEIIYQTKRELEDYFECKRTAFSVSLLPNGTEFQGKVWQSLLTIPYGCTTTYEKLALSLKNPLAIRAVAHAIGSNPIMIMIPCHRVIGKDGRLTGYAGGLANKQLLLDLESRSSLFGIEF